MKLICVGKIKEKYLNDAIKEYQKRLSKYTKLEIKEVTDLNYADIEKVKREEGKQILKNVKDTDYVIILDIKGEELSSIQLNDKLCQIETVNSSITFIIGGSYGLSMDVIKRANYKLSFSKLTFPHQLFRVILLEQIYRTYKIRNNENYHK